MFIDFDICNLTVTLPVLFFVLDLLFKIKYSKYQYLENGQIQRKRGRDDNCRVQYLLSNGIIANVILTVTYFFQGQPSNVNISKTVKASAKLQSRTVVDFNICHRMAPWRISCSLTLTQWHAKLNFRIYLLSSHQSVRGVHCHGLN